MKKFLTYTFGAVALYIVVDNYTGSGTVINDLARGYTGGVQALQGK